MTVEDKAAVFSVSKRSALAAVMAAVLGMGGTATGGAYYGARGLPTRMDELETRVQRIETRTSAIEIARAEDRVSQRQVATELQALRSELARRREWMTATTATLASMETTLEHLRERGRGDRR